MQHNAILKYLYGLESSKIKLGLENIQDLLNKIGNPEKELRCIHVAGTNGKGSVCAMLFYILKEAGYKVGLYTSPHLKKFNERIRINNNYISDKQIVDYYLKLEPYITNQSFFEITTAMAFLFFKKNEVDIAVIEVGLGGRLDATNTITPLVSVITNISLEHTGILGSTIEKIAFEKAGIIKENVPVVAGASGNALEVVKNIAKARNAPLFLTNKYPNIKFKHLSGSFQQRNKDIALTTINVLKKYYQIKTEKKQILEGIKKTKWPGRFQFLSKNVLVDCAHNSNGFKALIGELRQLHYRNLIVVAGFSADKDIRGIAKLLEPVADMIIITQSNNERAAMPKAVKKCFKFNPIIIKNPKRALTYAKKTASKKDLVLVTGSIYLVGEVI